MSIHLGRSAPPRLRQVVLAHPQHRALQGVTQLAGAQQRAERSWIARLDPQFAAAKGLGGTGTDDVGVRKE